MSEYAIEIKNLEKSFKQFNLGPINLAIPKGSIVGYIGQNGAGKSTTIKLLLGLLKPDQGIIKLLGEENINNTEIRNKLGIVFDDLFLPEELTTKAVAWFCSQVYSQ